ncbi:MAG: hypothetical protein JSR48_12515 [Verrucomicrobia bacterium]|nr:hypothetical protein [Verrucomicrobiota bacterium]
MKTLLLTLSLAAAGVSTASAQVYSPTVARSTVLGSIAGALIGGHNHDRWAEGAIIGAAAGAILGSVVDQPVAYSQPQVVGAPCAVQTQPAQVVYVNTPPPVRVVQVAPAPRVVYVNGYASAPCYVAPAPVVVIRPNQHHRARVVVYTRDGRRRD